METLIKEKFLSQFNRIYECFIQVSNPPKVTGAPMSVADFNVVVDTMLQGLGKQLRSCGVDVKILATADSHDKAAEIARKDNRVILTSGMPFLTVSGV